MRRFIKLFPALLLVTFWLDAPAQAETVVIKSGYVTTTNNGSRGRFAIAGPGLILNGRVHSSHIEGGGILVPNNFFKPGIFPYLYVTWMEPDTLLFDLPMTINWKQYLLSNSNITAQFSFDSPPLVIPPIGPTSLKITLPFKLNGFIHGYDGSVFYGYPSQLFGVSLTGQGALTMEFTRVNTQAFGEVYRLENSTYTFDETPAPLPPPVLLTEEESNSALALDAVTLRRGPFSVTSRYNLSPDRRTRLTLFGLYLDLQPGEDASAVVAQAEDARGRVYALAVEHVGKAQNFNWIDQVTVRVPDELAGAGDVRVSITLHGQVSNKAVVNFNSAR